MKKRFLFVVAITAAVLMSSFTVRADQLQLITAPESAIQSTVNFLKSQKQLVLWCACCDGDEKKLITVKNAGYKQAGAGSYFIFIEDTTGKVYDAVDLAYVHFFRDDGMAYNVGNNVWGSCDPCTEPFFMPGMIGHPLETIHLGGRHWMKRNLNVETADSWCNGNKSVNCERYGRLYTWDAAVKACADLGDGWRLPNDDDWNALGTGPGSDFPSRNGGYYSITRNGLPVQSGGFYNREQNFFHGDDNYGMWWSATEKNANEARYRDISLQSSTNFNISNNKINGMSVRCIRDNEFTQTAAAAMPAPEAPPQPEPEIVEAAQVEVDDEGNDGYDDDDGAPVRAVRSAGRRQSGHAAVGYDRSGTASRRVGDFVADPNPVSRQSDRSVEFYLEGMAVRSWMLSVYDSRSQLVTRFSVTAPTASWDLRDARGRMVVAGRYEIRGSAMLANGRRESVSVMVGVR